MKFVLCLAALLLNLNANAEVKLPGTILKSQCAKATENNPRIGGYMLTEVCTATIVGSKKKYLLVEESRVLRGGPEKQTTVWEITTEKETRASSTLEVVEAGYRDAKGLFQEKASLSFVTGKVKAKLKSGRSNYSEMTGELGGREFSATGFQVIFHTM